MSIAETIEIYIVSAIFYCEDFVKKRLKVDFDLHIEYSITYETIEKT